MRSRYIPYAAALTGGGTPGSPPRSQCTVVGGGLRAQHEAEDCGWRGGRRGGGEERKRPRRQVSGAGMSHLAVVGALTVLVLAVDESVAVANLQPGSTPQGHAINWVHHPQIVQQLHQLVGEAAGDETAVEKLLRQGIQSPWANQSLAERTQQAQLHLGERGKRYRAERRASEHRRLQTNVQENDASIAAYLNATEGVSCTDPLATNNGAARSCVYDCRTLQEHFFPGRESRCFLYDATMATWPEELLSMRQRYMYMDTFLSVEDGTNPPGEGLMHAFNMGAGRQCINVTIHTTVFGIDDHPDEIHTEVRCLIDGEHEYNHTVVGDHSVEVVGYADSGVHVGPGGTTSIVIGECTDVVIRVTTTVSAGPMTWRLNDGGHNGPWDFDFPGEMGVHELETCMFDNDYTLVRQGGTGWQGSVEVIGFIRFHNTIEIPNDESWIIQGGIDISTGLPASLDGRLSSGTILSPSQSNIVLRDMRFSGQTAPIDPHVHHRTQICGNVPGTSRGGAFSYSGGGDDPSNLPRLIFERVIFDHNTASYSTGVNIDGNAGFPSSSNPSQTNWNSGISLKMRGCTFFRNHGGIGGAIGTCDVWPQQFLFEDVDYIQNVGIMYHHEAHIRGPMPSAADRRRAGESWYHSQRCHYDGGGTEGILSIIPIAHMNYDTSDDPESVSNVTLEGTTAVDHAMVVWSVVLYLGHWPPIRNDYGLQYHVHLIDHNLAGTLMLTVGDQYDTPFVIDMGLHTLVERSRFENNGPIVEGSVGTGGWTIYRPSSVLPGYWPTVRFVNTEFIQNRATHGAAVGVIDGLVDLSFDSCVFRGNTAARTGGAISFGASASSHLVVEHSIFESNVVELQESDDTATAAVVIVNTGGLGEGSQDVYGTYHMPIWRVDNGPVYGVPWEMCEAAKQYSQDVVAQGFSETWASDLKCANVTYHSQTSYSQVELVANGVHTLFHGVVTQGSQIITQWLKGSIQVVGAVGPVFPTFTDIRSEHLPFCDYGGSCGTELGNNFNQESRRECCPRGVSMWSSTEFFVSAGTGGAIDARGSVHVSISDSEFRNNDAPQGATLRLTSTLSNNITGTSIDKPMDQWSTAVSLSGTEISTCADNPCGIGSSCTFVDDSTHCLGCGPNEIGVDGISCVACPPGSQPNDEHTECRQCESGRVSTIGVCVFCAAGKTSSADRTACIPCQPGTRRGAEDDECVPCPAGTQSSDSVECRACPPGASPTDSRDGCTACVAGKHSADGIECTSCDAGSQPSASLTGCDACTLSGPNAYSSDGVACQDCPARNAPNYERTECFCQTNTYNALELGVVTCHGTSSLLDGMQSFGISDECAICPPCMDCSVVGKTMLKAGWAFFGANQAFPCPGADEFEACPALLLDSNTTMDSSTCAMGYEGPVCGSCQDNYNHLKVGNPCDSCDGHVVNVPLIVGLLVVAALVGSAIVSGAMDVLTDHGVITDVKLLIGFWQILSQCSNVLDLTFPHPIPKISGYVKLLFLDVRSLVKMDCMNLGGFYGKITTNVVVVPLAVVIVCLLIFEVQRRSLAAVVAAGGADQSAFVTLKVKLKHNLFLGIFLVYPSVTTTLFRVFQCKRFGEASFHEDDYDIDCSTTKFMLTQAASMLIIILVPIGIPAVFLFLMIRTKLALGGVVYETATGGAKLSPDDVEEGDDAFAFLTRDYHPEQYYYEIITYSKKLVLSGISVLVGRGTVAQIYFVITAEAFFLMHHVRNFPFVLYKHNVIEALGHQGLMLMYAITLILRNDDEDMWQDEWFPKEGYGWFLAVVAVLVLPSPTVYFYYKETKSKSRFAESEEEFQENPLSQTGQSDAFEDERSNLSSTPSARLKLAKMQRESKNMLAQTQKKLMKLQRENSALREELKIAEQTQSATSHFQHPQLAELEDVQPAFSINKICGESIAELKGLAEEGTLSDETWQAAKLVLDSRIALELQENARQHRLDGAKTEKRILQEEARALPHLKTQIWDQTTKAEAGLVTWLSENRLLHHKDKFYAIGGSAVSTEDLKLCREEDIEHLAAYMTTLEAARFTAAIVKLQSSPSADPEPKPEPELELEPEPEPEHTFD